jgi:hypothetical protein
MVSKLNNDRKAGEGAGQAIGRIYGKIGFGGLWNGLPVRIFMIGTLTAFQWLIYDSFKVYLGVSSFSALLRVPRNANGGVAADNGRTLNAQRDATTDEGRDDAHDRDAESLSRYERRQGRFLARRVIGWALKWIAAHNKLCTYEPVPLTESLVVCAFCYVRSDVRTRSCCGST